jgi:hypothetical protein
MGPVSQEQFSPARVKGIMKFHALLIGLAVALCAADAHAKAAFFGKAQIVKESAAIAIVEITAVEQVETRSEHWTYRQRATARVEQQLKGPIMKHQVLTLLGDETFICAQCRFAPGKYLVFLQKSGESFTGTNWQLSTRAVCTVEGKEQIDWYAGDDDVHAVKAMPAEEVIAEVKKLIEGED